MAPQYENRVSLRNTELPPLPNPASEEERTREEEERQRRKKERKRRKKEKRRQEQEGGEEGRTESDSEKLDTSENAIPVENDQHVQQA